MPTPLPIPLRLAWLATLTVTLLGGCGASNNPQVQREAVQRRIEYNEFAACPAKKVRIEHLHDDYWRATGCGKSMVFDVSGTCRRRDDCRAEPEDGK